MSATTDFVAAQNQNRRNTMVLLAVLTLLAGGIGYLVGALLETESSGALPAVSQMGIAAAGLMAAVSIGWSAISLASAGASWSSRGAAAASAAASSSG